MEGERYYLYAIISKVTSKGQSRSILFWSQRHVEHFAKCAHRTSTKVTFLSGNFKCPITVMPADWLTSRDLIPAISQLPIKVAGIVESRSADARWRFRGAISYKKITGATAFRRKLRCNLLDRWRGATHESRNWAKCSLQNGTFRQIAKIPLARASLFPEVIDKAI